jgi:hypothetical protein
VLRYNYLRLARDAIFLRKERHLLTIIAVIGTLKGYDQLMNLVLDEVKEALTGKSTRNRLVVSY